MIVIEQELSAFQVFNCFQVGQPPHTSLCMSHLGSAQAWHNQQTNAGTGHLSLYMGSVASTAS